ncbi:hypothetical protein SDC9_120255 [bioreactor metagenome]|uniref:Uncharacterized protein n=1 Tax=bioreactor metagenome TaxID=1076179 RepID=A0A645C6K3_9ZZZZ
MEFAQFDVIGLEKLPHHVRVLLQGQTVAVDIVVRIRFIKRFAPVQPSIVPIVPIFESLLKPLSDRILKILTHYFSSFGLAYFLCSVNLGITITGGDKLSVNFAMRAKKNKNIGTFVV